MRLIDADRLIDEFEDTIGSPIARTRLKLQVQNQPTIEAVEVVRCYKCIHWDENTVRRNSNDATWWNEAVCRKYSDDILEVWKDADWFCADGEMKEGDGE